MTTETNVPREITCQHPDSSMNLTLEALDGPGDGGASHVYRISHKLKDGTPSFSRIIFQKGPIGEVGVNGVSDESLLAIVRDRLEGFQRGPYACGENGVALDCVSNALKSLHGRTGRRLAAGVEGTHDTAVGDASHPDS